MSRPQENAVPVRVSKQEFEDRLLVRTAYTKPQPTDFVTVVETAILRDRAGQAQTPGKLPAGRSLLLKLHNGTDGPVTAVTFRIEQHDRRGNSLGVSDYAADGFSVGVGEDFVPDVLILLDAACTDVTVELLTADTQGCRLMRAGGQNVLTYAAPAPRIQAPDEAHTAVYSKTARLRIGAWPAMLALLLLIALTAVTVWRDPVAKLLEMIISLFR